MALWIIEFDTKEILKTLIIAIIVIFLGLIVFYQLWLTSEEFKVPIDYFKFKNQNTDNIGFFWKMKLLIRDIWNHDFWIWHVGFDAYCYLLFLWKLIIVLITYTIIYGLSSLILYVLKSIMNMGYINDVDFEKNSTNIYIIMMVFTLTILILVGLKNFRWEV